MECSEQAKKLYLSDKANSASSVLQSLSNHGLISCSKEVLQATESLGEGLGAQETCSCLVAAAMATSLAKSKPQDKETAQLTAKKTTSQITEAFRQKYNTTKCSELTSHFQDFSSETRKNHCAEIVEFVTHKTNELLTKQEIDSGNFSLTRFIEYLSQLPDDQFSAENVFNLMKQVSIDPKEIKKCINFSPDNYARNLFFKDSRFEVLVMCWGKDQKSPIHDHYTSFSVEKIFSGGILNTNYHRVDPESDVIKEADSQDLSVGDVIFSHPGEIHKIEPTNNAPAVSIHLYSPPLKQMKFFNLETQTSHWAKLGYLYIYEPAIWQSLASCHL
jgi:C_GCAxxG_C_C family probable redox protein